MRLNILSGGAAQSVVTALAADFRAATGYELDCTFSAVGAMKAKLLAGAPADLIILTHALIAELAAGGQVLTNSCAAPCSPQRASSCPIRKQRPRASISPACWTPWASAAKSSRG